MKSLGFAPRAPVPIEQFGDPEMRRKWASEKHMMVFSLFSPQHGRTEIDLFLEPPFDFEAAFGRSITQEVAPGIAARFCGLDDLIELKQKAARPRDLQDVSELRALIRKDTP